MRLGVMIAAFVLLAAVAFADHRHTRAVSARASSDSWWCSHEQVRCTGFDEVAHHAGWESRERGYAAGAVALTAAIVILGGRRLRLRL
jgi:hypothetical protein